MTPPDSATSPWRQLTGYQWLVLVVAWLGVRFHGCHYLRAGDVGTPQSPGNKTRCLAMSGPGRTERTSGNGGCIRGLPGDGGMVAAKRIVVRERCWLPALTVAGTGDDDFTQPEPDFGLETRVGML